MAAVSADIGLIRRISLWCGSVALIFGILMAVDYGYQHSYKHAVILGLVAIAAPVAMIFARWLKKEGHKVPAGLFYVAAYGLLAAEFTVHFAYTVGHRMRDEQETGVQNAKWTGAQEATGEEKTNLALWKKQLEALQAQAPWAATVKAEALRKEAKLLEDRVALETEGKRGRSKGCGKECESLQNQLKDVNAKLATAEKSADLATRIEATQRILDGKRDTAAKTEFKSSKIVNQTVALARIATLDMESKPSDAIMAWVQTGMALLIATITTYLATLFLYIAFWGAEAKEKLTNVSRSMAAAVVPRGHAPQLVNTSFSDVFEQQYKHGNAA